MSMERGTGGNRFIDHDASIPDLMRVIHEGLYELADWAADTERAFDLAAITVTTHRIPSGKISVEVAGDLAAPVPHPAATNPSDGEPPMTPAVPSDGGA